MLAAIAWICLGASGCFALFPLDEYGPGSGDGSVGDSSLPEGGKLDAPIDTVVRYEGSVAFVTSARILARNVNGLGGADGICQAIASDAGYDATFKAFLGDRSDGVSSRLRRDGGRIVTKNGLLVASSFDDLFGSGAQNALVEDERGNAVAIGGSCEEGGAAWTGTLPDGGLIPAGDCSRWQADQGNSGVASALGRSGSGWIEPCLRPCGNPAALYCLQQ